ncbi:hypothetical protein [Bacillus nakamurai]|uniref:hypothetical protein n=1 Tax=Bacillus nakamurai TaxID=1793963 RepID=UPI001E583042|nr:hypothetical protein [Bacillus nakamurai]MCC9021698.1 hypothetical protein [Bacillus nakamurai]
MDDAEHIVTEKRKATNGKRIMLTAPTNTKGSFRTGDTFTVSESGENGVTVNADVYMTIWHSEYEVIVNNEVKNEEDDGMEIDLNGMGYEELLAHGDSVMEAIKKRTFQEGFRAAKQVQRKMNAEKSAQARRDEIVEMAKVDVENLKVYGKQSSRSTQLGNLTYREYYYSVEFKVSSNKRKVSALIYPIGRLGFISGRPIHVGRAKATPDDCFNVHIGKAIALRRALGLAVPDEYLNAPQPTDIRVGDIVEYPPKWSGVVIADDDCPPFPEKWVQLKDAREYGLKVIDDSREEVVGE